MTARYRAVADALIADIRAGRYQPGDKLPTMRAVMADLGVGYTVVQDAFAVMAREGWVELNRRSGTFVSAVLPEPVAPSLADRVAELEERVARLESGETR